MYLFKREFWAWVNRFFFYMFRVFPIRNDLISICTFEGKGGFGCNPKYLVQELHRRNPNYKFVWIVNDMNKEFPDYIKKVPNNILSRIYWLSVSKLWIDNYRKPYGTKKRLGQYYLNVNHYTLAIKCTGLWREKGFSEMAYRVSKNDSDMMDGLVIDSRWCEIVSPKGFLFSEPYFKTGSPRCDILHGNRDLYRNKLREKHGIGENSRIVMYAPTFREGAKDGKRRVFSTKCTLDFSMLIDNMEKKFGGTWFICTRLHPQLAGRRSQSGLPLSERMIDESHADDMYEILAGADAYITDYSSASFEASLAGIPVFLYADDIDEYSAFRGNMMWEMKSTDRSNIPNNKMITPDINTTLPFSLARTNDELKEDINNFDWISYKQKIYRFSMDIDVLFDGNASFRLANIVESWLK